MIGAVSAADPLRSSARVVQASGTAAPSDPVGEAVAASVAALLGRGKVTLRYTPAGEPRPDLDGWTATAAGPDGWLVTLTVDHVEGARPRTDDDEIALPSVFALLPAAALRAGSQLRRRLPARADLTPAMHRALRDTVVTELLADVVGETGQVRTASELLADVLEFLIELSGMRVESHDVTHGVIITDAIRDEPRIQLPYPVELRAAKRGPLLFDGQRSVLVVDRTGRARTELQRHRLSRLLPERSQLDLEEEAFVDAGALVALATRHLGGLGFFLRADRSIWAFADGGPLFVRRGEHWTSYPLELGIEVGRRIGACGATDAVAQTAFLISNQRHGAILAIVDDASTLDGVVAPKDRYDLRNEIDPTASRAETRLHHLIDLDDDHRVDHLTLARLAALDGATVVDREGHLLAYGAIVASKESQHEGARTAAARTLSEAAAIVIKVSEDGEMTIFQDGRAVTTVLRSGPPA